MKKGVWVAALALGLWRSSGAFGQESPFAIARSSALNNARSVGSSGNGATLCKPVPIIRGVSPEPRPFPDAYRNVPHVHRYSSGGIEPIATVPPPGSVIASSGTGQTTAPPPLEEPREEIMPGELFASDRVGPLPARLPQAALPTSQMKISSTILPVQPTQPPIIISSPSPSGIMAEKMGDWITTFQQQPPHMTPAQGVFVEGMVEESLPPTKWYVRGEYLLWWTKPDKSFPLVTSTLIGADALSAIGRAIKVNPNNPALAGLIDTIGALGSPGTVILSDGELRRSPQSGGRFTGGYYLDDCGEKAIELSGFFLGRRSANFTADAFQNDLLARPYFAANDGNLSRVEPLNFPALTCGKVSVEAPSEIWGLEPSLLCKLCCGCEYRIDGLVGMRYLNLRESISVTENVLFSDGLRVVQDGTNNIVPSPLAGAKVFIQDRFACSNQFYGGQIGVEGRWQRDRFTIDGRAKLALGVTQQNLQVSGESLFFNASPAVAPRQTGGLLALNSNIGDFSKSAFSVVPEATVSVGYYLTDRLRATIGYDVLYWSKVVRPGAQLNPSIDEARVPSFQSGDFSPPRPLQPTTDQPARLFRTTDYWAHGITAGLEFRY